jgi:hypothetical protein
MQDTRHSLVPSWFLPPASESSQWGSTGSMTLARGGEQSHVRPHSYTANLIVGRRSPDECTAHNAGEGSRNRCRPDDHVRSPASGRHSMADALAISRSIMTCLHSLRYSTDSTVRMTEGCHSLDTQGDGSAAMYGTLEPPLTPADGSGGQVLGHSRLSWCLLEGV